MELGELVRSLSNRMCGSDCPIFFSNCSIKISAEGTPDRYSAICTLLEDIVPVLEPFLTSSPTPPEPVPDEEFIMRKVNVDD